MKRYYKIGSKQYKALTKLKCKPVDIAGNRCNLMITWDVICETLRDQITDFEKEQLLIMRNNLIVVPDHNAQSKEKTGG